jgi:solute carrier family 41
MASSPATGLRATLTTVLQVFPTFLVAGLGMVGAGLLLNEVQTWPSFTTVEPMMVMVPALLGLKGNLEMTLASRLSTASNLGKLDCRADATSMILGNLVLVQCQGIVVGFLASLVGMALAWGPDLSLPDTWPGEALLLCTTAIVTASLASFILGLVMVGVILLARRLDWDPDNVATPIAASLGDVTTLGLLAVVAHCLYGWMMAGQLTAFIILGIYSLLLPGLLVVAYKNPVTAPVLVHGWPPILLSMLISSGGGLILHTAVESFTAIAMFAPVMNGAGGNLVAIQASRMTTYLNRATNSLYGIFPCEEDRVCVLPCSALCGGLPYCLGKTNTHHASTARLLLAILLPGHLIFVLVLCMLEAHGVPSVFFLALYMLAGLCQVRPA